MSGWFLWRRKQYLTKRCSLYTASFLVIMQSISFFCLNLQPTAIKRLQNILQGDGTKIARETIGSYLDYFQFKIQSV